MKIIKDIPSHGDERIITKFLFVPMTVRVKDEEGRWHRDTRWLITQSFRQRYYSGHWEDGWETIQFIDN